MKRLPKLLVMLASFCLASNASAQDEEVQTGKEGFDEEFVDEWVLVQAGTLIAEPDKPVLQDHTIVIKNGIIEAIIAGFEVDEELAPDASVIDLSDSFVLPGLIDAHVHLMSGDDDGDAFAVATIVRNAGQALQSGVTTVRDMGSWGQALQAYRVGWSDGTFEGPRVRLSGPAIRAGAEEGECYDAGSCKKEVRSRIAQEAEWIKLYATCSGFETCGNGPAPGVFTQDELAAVFDAAATRSIPVAAHAHSVGGINDALRAGARSIEHGSYLDQASIRLFLEKNAYLVPTLSVLNYLEGEREVAPEEMLPIFEAALENHPEGVGTAFRAGVMIGAGSDAPLTAFGDFHQELAWLVKIGMTPMQALRSATIVNAQMMMIDDEVGSIAVGKSADIIAVAEDPAVDIEAMSSVDFVMIRGEVVKSKQRPDPMAADATEDQ